jgi:hypothetical protein
MKRPTHADDLPASARNYQPDPALIRRNHVPVSEVRKLILAGATREEIEKLSRFGGSASK